MDGKPMKGIRHLSIEIGPHCDRARDHIKCPAHYRKVDRALMSTERIIETIRAALELGFDGFVSFHFYNEPTLYGSRMTEVMDAVPEARYMLWSNGFSTALHPRFDWVEVRTTPSPSSMIASTTTKAKDGANPAGAHS